MSERDIQRVVKMRKVGPLWSVIREYDGAPYVTTWFGTYAEAKDCELNLIRLGYRAEQ